MNARRSVADLMRMDGRVVAITGGAGHIGRALGEAVAELGARVAVLDLPGAAAAGALALNAGASGTSTGTGTSGALGTAGGPRHVHVDVDLSDVARAGEAIDAVVAQCGRLDVLVHCAALVGTSALSGWAVPFEQQALPAWMKALDVNLSSAFVLVQRALPHLRAAAATRTPASVGGGGTASIVVVGSIYGVSGPDWRLYEGTALGNPAAYAASKGALLQMVKWWSTTLAPDVRVNAISPGGVFRDTPEPFHTRYVERTPMRRMATEEDFKGALAFLASDASAYVTGQNLLVDGGWTAW